MARLAARTLITLCAALLVGGAALLGYRSVRNEVAARVYRDRLVELADRYSQLRAAYNDVVRRTAVTELVVEDGLLSVVVRDAHGEVKRIATPFDPAGEIYVDFVVVGGRLWIRRIFDETTPPGQGLVIDPKLRHVSWQSGDAHVGKAVYRSLGEGRWVVTVTGNGALGLERAETSPAPLEAAPAVISPDELTTDVDQRVSAINAQDVWRQLTGG